MSNIDMDDWEDFCDDFKHENYKNVYVMEELNNRSFEIIGLRKLKKLFINVFGDTKYYNIISSMINIDPTFDIDLYETYYEFPSELKILYPLSECSNRKHSPIFLDKLTTNLDQHIELFKSAIELKFSVKKCFSLINSIELFLRLLKTYTLIDKRTTTNVFMIFWWISSIMNNDGAVDVKLCQRLLNLQENECYSLMLNVCTSIKFDVYPECENIEWNKVCEDIWKDVFIVDDNKFNLNIFSFEMFEIIYDDFRFQRRYEIDTNQKEIEYKQSEMDTDEDMEQYENVEL
jgi:hypothetical protein